MRKQKEVLSAGIIRDLRFRSRQCFDVYIEDLSANHYRFKVFQVDECSDGTVYARVMTTYNFSPFIDLSEV